MRIKILTRSSSGFIVYDNVISIHDRDNTIMLKFEKRKQVSINKDDILIINTRIGG